MEVEGEARGVPISVTLISTLAISVFLDVSVIAIGDVYVIDATDRRRPRLKRPIHYHSGKGAPSAADRGLRLYYLRLIYLI